MNNIQFNRLKEFRLEYGWSQTKLASMINISRQTINNIERGKTKCPKDATLIKIAIAFNQPIEKIFFTPLVQHVLQKW